LLPRSGQLRTVRRGPRRRGASLTGRTRDRRACAARAGRVLRRASLPPEPGGDARTAGRRRGARGSRPDEHGACGRGPREPACRGGGGGRHRPADRPGGDVADFNTNNKQAMMRSEVLSWPLTMVLLVIAFGTLVAAGLPLLL